MTKTKVFNLLRSIWKIPVLEKVLVSFTQDKYYGSFVSKITPNHYQYKNNTIRTVTRAGINYHLDISDLIDWYTFFGFKEKTLEDLIDLAQTGNTVIDIGANIGAVTLCLAKKVTPQGMIHSFEPDAVNFQKLKKNIALNNFGNIKINQLGLGNTPGVFNLEILDKNNKGKNRITENLQGDKKNSTSIKVITLDTYAKENNIKNINLIKIDVEGFEHNILLGGIETIRANKPILFIEIVDENLVYHNTSATALIQLLEKEKYTIIEAGTNKEITSNLDFSGCHIDIIATPI